MNEPWRDPEVLEELYIEEALSTRQIADKLDCGRRTVTNWLYRTGVKQPDGEEPYHDEDKLRDLYVNQELSTEEIGERFDCSSLTIERWITRHGISGERSQIRDDTPWRDEERLRELYCGLGLTNREIGDFLDCSGYCVSRWLKRKNIEIKDPKYRKWSEIKRLRENDEVTTEQLANELNVTGEVIENQHLRYQTEVVNGRVPSRHQGPNTDKPWHDPEKLETLYREEGLTAENIADELGCGESTVHRWLRTFGIEADENRPWTDKQLMKELYLEEGLEIADIAEEFGCAYSTILSWLDRYNIRQEEKTPLWQLEGILRTLYTENDWSVDDIAEELGAHTTTIRKWLRRHDIKTPGRGGGQYQSEEVLRRMYLVKEMSVTEIGDRLDCSHSTISYWLARHGIPTRTRDDVGHRLRGEQFDGDEPPYKNEQLLRQLFEEEEMSISEIARELGHSEGIVRDFFYKFDISVDAGNFSLDDIDYSIPDENPWRDEELMRILYVSNDLSTTKISEILDCSSATVSTWLRKHDIDTSREYNRPSSLELKKMYVDKKLSGLHISRKLDVHQSTVYRWLREAEIEIRDPWEYTHPDLEDEAKMREMYVNKKLSVAGIAKELGSHRDTVKRALEKHRIQRRSQSEEISGRKNPFWKGGQEPYGKGWAEKKRQDVLERDGYSCQYCGKDQQEHIDETGQGLHIHHIIPASQIEDPKERNDVSNLVTMCSSCHKVWEGIPLKPHLLSD